MSEVNTKLDKILDKIDKLDERQDRSEVALAKNTQILDEHQRRSVALENYANKLEGKLAEELVPIKSRMDFAKTAFVVLAWAGGTLASIAAFIIALKELGLI